MADALDTKREQKLAAGFQHDLQQELEEEFEQGVTPTELTVRVT